MWLTTIIIFAEGFLITAYESVVNEKSFFFFKFQADQNDSLLTNLCQYKQNVKP